MTDKEKIQNMFNCFYNFNEDTQKIKRDFLANKELYSEILGNTLKAIREIEKLLNIKLSEHYIEFLQAEIGNYIYNPDSIDEFRAYDAEELYGFNYIGEKVGDSAIEELKDFLIVGQDEGENSYFFDIHNTLHYGIDTFWRVDRSLCSDFEIVGKTFIDFLEQIVLRKPINALHPFEKEKKTISGNNKAFFIKKLCEQMSADELYITSNKISVSKNYLSEIKRRNDVRFISTEYSNQHIETLIKLQNIMNNAFPTSFVFLLLHLDDFSFYQGNIFFLLLLDEQLEVLNIGKKSKTYLKNMFIFACNSYSLFSKINGSYVDYFFIDPTNKLGEGPDAIYMISEKSKKLAEACYVAKDIADFFRSFAEGKELSTTPIGTIPGE